MQPSALSMPSLRDSAKPGGLVTVVSASPHVSSQPAQTKGLPVRSQQPTKYEEMTKNQFECGPLLRYDTIENGEWHGAALIVSELFIPSCECQPPSTSAALV